MSRAAGNRRLATVLVTDIVGSTERAAALGDRAWRELIRRHDRLVRREIARCRGHEINTAGDGFLATFGAPEQALRCACAVRRAVRSLALEIRAGIHTGEVEIDEGSAAGIAVHIAARVVAHSGPGEVLVSNTVRELGTGSGYGFEDRGSHVLKGAPGEWRLFAVASEPLRVPVRDLWSRARDALDAMGPARATAAGILAAGVLFGLTGLYVTTQGRRQGLPPTPAMASNAFPGIAVLPFDITGPGVEISREGFVDLLSTNLDGLGDLRAIESRTVLARWREMVPDTASADLATMLEVARRTGARYALVGRAIAVGDEIRLAAELYDTRSRSKVGAAQAVGSRRTLIGVIDRLTVQLVGSALDVQRVSGAGLASVTTDSLEALKAYLHGESALRRADWTAASQAFHRALQVDSTFALAASRLARTLAWDEGYDAAVPHALRAARWSRRLTERDSLLVRGELALYRGLLVGLPPLQLATSRYHEDAEAWYLLGDTYFHLGAQALVEPGAAEDALRHAVELDPSFAPFQIHLIELAFHRADSAEAARLLERYERVAPGSFASRTGGIAFGLAFGDSAQRVRAREALRDEETGVQISVTDYFEHPRFRPLEESVLRSLPRFKSSQEEFVAAAELASNLFARGKMREALAALEQAVVPARFRAASLYTIGYSGFPVAQELLDSSLSLSESDGGLNLQTFFAGAYAAEQARWPDHEAAVTALAVDADRLHAAGDSARAGFVAAMRSGLQAYGDWRRERTTAALLALQSAQQAATGQDEGRAHVNAILRLWLGQILYESGRPRNAERYLRVREATHVNPHLSPGPLATLRLAAVYEELGRPNDARDAYRLFVLAWRDADPELQPVIEQAGRAADRLAALSRE